MKAINAMVVLGLVLLASCSNSIAHETTYTLSGTVTDKTSGAGIAGAIFHYAGVSETTGSDGKFSMDLGSSTAIINGYLSVDASGYEIDAIDSVTLDPKSNLAIIIKLQPNSTTGYTKHTLTGRVYQADGTTEISDSQVDIQVLSIDGRNHRSSVVYSPGTGFSLDSLFFGADCLVTVSASSLSSQATLMKKVNLSGSTTTVDFIDASGPSAIALAGSGNWTQAMLYLVSPYGNFEIGRVNYGGSGTVNYSNPFGYSGFSLSYYGISDSPSTGDNKTYYSCGSSGTLGSSMTLPTIDTSLCPSADVMNIAYLNGLLSFDPVAGANEYLILIYASDGSTIRLFSQTTSFSVPIWLQTKLSGQTLQTKVCPVYWNIANNMGSIVALLQGGANVPGVVMNNVFPGAPTNLTF
jgi:hypothetical protein